MRARRLLCVVTVCLSAASAPAVAQVGEASPAVRLADEAPGRQVSAQLSPKGSSFVEGQNVFAVDLYKASVRPSGNLSISPASVSTAIALAYRGARGATADEMARTMHFPAGPAETGEGAGELLATMRLDGLSRELVVANSLWIQRGLPLDPAYLADVNAHFGAALYDVDFATDENKARSQINGWVEDKTHQRIRDPLLPDDVSNQTKAILVDAIYLKAAWAAQFSRQATRDEPFQRLDGSKVIAPLMHQRGKFRLIERDGTQAIAMSYAGSEIEMIVFLPRSPDGLPKLEKTLTAELLRRWTSEVARAPYADTILALPRFRVEWRADLVEPLKAMGMRIALSDEADFSGMKSVRSNSLDSNDWGVKIRHVIHQTFLEADENGSEAAASTAVVVDVVVSGKRMPPPPPLLFRADRPFLFLIRDTRTGAILFMGRFASPDAETPLPSRF